MNVSFGGLSFLPFFLGAGTSAVGLMESFFSSGEVMVVEVGGGVSDMGEHG